MCAEILIKTFDELAFFGTCLTENKVVFLNRSDSVPLALRSGFFAVGIWGFRQFLYSFTVSRDVEG